MCSLVTFNHLQAHQHQIMSFCLRRMDYYARVQFDESTHKYSRPKSHSAINQFKLVVHHNGFNQNYDKTPGKRTSQGKTAKTILMANNHLQNTVKIPFSGRESTQKWKEQTNKKRPRNKKKKNILTVEGKSTRKSSPT